MVFIVRSVEHGTAAFLFDSNCILFYYNYSHCRGRQRLGFSAAERIEPSMGVLVFVHLILIVFLPIIYLGYAALYVSGLYTEVQ